jgi:hypothetical protein
MIMKYQIPEVEVYGVTEVMITAIHGSNKGSTLCQDAEGGVSRTGGAYEVDE